MTIKLSQTKHMINNHLSTVKYGILFIALIGYMGWIFFHHTQLHLCLTPSLDGIRVLLFQKITPIKKGDIISIQGHVYKHLGVQPYAKRIIGFASDSIVREENTIKIGERILPLMEKTKEGHILTPITHTIVPEGYLFVAGDHPRSIDSRYEEFGLVAQEKVWGKAVLAW